MKSKYGDLKASRIKLDLGKVAILSENAQDYSL
jgi:hypothetical protein